MNMKLSPSPYRADPQIASLGAKIGDAVRPANFPETILRFRNDRWAATVGLADYDDAAWLRHFGRFEPLPDNMPEPLALRYHGHQFRAYNPNIGDGRGFLFAQMRDGDGRLLDLATKGSGTTPYSRRGDGRLTLKGGVREILATEMLEARRDKVKLIAEALLEFETLEGSQIQDLIELGHMRNPPVIAQKPPPLPPPPTGTGTTEAIKPSEPDYPAGGLAAPVPA
jgi:hypothetical protein